MASMHTHTTVLQLSGFCPGTTRMSQYQKKHSPTYTCHGHQSSLICLIHLLRSMASSLFKFTCLTVFFHNFFPSFFWFTCWPDTLNFILHTFLHPIIVFFSQHTLIPSQPVLPSNLSLSLNRLLGTIL